MNNKTGSSDKQKVLYVIVGIVVAALIVLSVSSIGRNGQEEAAPVQAQESEQSAVTPSVTSDEDKIKESIGSALASSTTDTGLSKVSDVNIVKLSDGSYEVEADINSDSFQGLLILENESAGIYKDLYSGDFNVSKTTINAYHEFSDDYGNLTNEKVLTTSLGKDVADKINFDADELQLQVSIIPGLWTKSFVSHKDGY